MKISMWIHLRGLMRVGDKQYPLTKKIASWFAGARLGSHVEAHCNKLKMFTSTTLKVKTTANSSPEPGAVGKCGQSRAADETAIKAA